MATTMLPAPELLTTPVAGSPILATGRAEAGVREQLRRIPTFHNAVAIMSVWVQAAAVLALVGWIGPWMWLPCLLLLGRTHAQLAALMHEAAHRLLFRNRRVNDWVGRWVLGYPSFAATDAYRRVHMAHHRQEFGPDEPDLPLYTGYPIITASLRRKLIRDATGQTGWKLMKAQLQGFRSPDRRVRRTVWSILAVQLALFGVMTLAGYPILYVLWVGSYFTVWRVINRLRSIAEHGGMQASTDRRETTHSVVQHWLARCFLVPYHIGWHLAHHVDSGVPWRNLPRYHQLLREYGYVTPGLEYPSYPALWRKLASGPRAEVPAAATDAAA